MSDVLTTVSLGIEGGSGAALPARVPAGHAGRGAILELSVRVPGDEAAVRVGEPVTVGVPFPQGLHVDAKRIGVSGRSGLVPVQVEPLERWPDGSIRWALLDFAADAPAVYTVVPVSDPAPCGEPPVPAPGELAEIRANGLAFRVPSSGSFCMDVCDERAGGAARRISAEVTRADGELLRPEVTSTEWEARGPLRSVLRVDAIVRMEDGRPLRFTIRLHFHLRKPAVRCEIAILNPGRAHHPGGFWELGDAGSVLIRDCSVRLELGTRASARCSVEPGRPFESVAPPMELYQDSSGGENWDSPVHVNREGRIPVTFRGYRLRSGGTEQYGLRATPVLWAGEGSAQTGVAMRYFWQNSPKALEADSRQVVLRLFPGQFADLHEIQGGERKTHSFYVAFGEDGVSELPLDWVRRPVFVSANPAWYAHAQAAPYITPAADDPNGEYTDIVASIVEGPQSFEAKREIIDEYGWRNFGDIYADHEAVFNEGPLISHYNNQYDGVAGFAYQFFRTADPRWWVAMDELAWHVRDIDIYQTSEDKSAYSGGLFWHTFHYVDAGRSTHRSYPRLPGVAGGGPANEHVYSTGLMLHYLLTGDRSSRDAAVGLAEWAFRLDNGMLTPFRWLSHGETGYASKTHTADYHGPGRGAGNVIVVLLNGYRLTGRAHFLHKADALIRRCIHPHDVIESRRLLDPESRWSYTVFLQALGRYLDEKVLRGEIDERYTYAQESLLRYAHWMLAHEYLYLDKPEILEYPTETWAAQDMRKSDVFMFAARHADEPERSLFMTRAHYFFRESVRMLGERPTRFTARPRVLLMTCGFMQAAFKTDAYGRRSPQGPKVAGFGDPIVFKPQRSVVKRRLRRIALAAALGALGLVGAGAAIALS